MIALLLGNIWRTAFILALAFAGTQTLRLSWAKADRDAAIAESGGAIQSNKIAIATIAALEAQRDGLLLTRAAEAKEREDVLQEAAQIMTQQNILLRKANERINELAALPRCQQVMQMQVCPEIERELRAP